MTVDECYIMADRFFRSRIAFKDSAIGQAFRAKVRAIKRPWALGLTHSDVGDK